MLGPAEGGRHLPPQPSVPGEVWVGPTWPRTPLSESPSPREDVRRGGGGMCSVQFSVSFVLPALRPGKHVSSDGVPCQGEKELGLVRSGRIDGLGPVECFDRGSGRDLRPACGLEFHSELLVWCFTKHSTWALVARGGAFALRLAPPTGWLVWSAYLSLGLRACSSSPRLQFPNPLWLVSWGLCVWRGPFTCGLLQLSSSTPSIGTMDVRHWSPAGDEGGTVWNYPFSCGLWLIMNGNI